MSLSYLQRNFKFISSHPSDITLITSDGHHIPTHQHLLSAVSPFLASLIVQAGQTGSVLVSLPFQSEVVRLVLDKLLSPDEDANTIECDGFIAAIELGIVFFKQKVAIIGDSSKKEVETDENFVFEEYPDDIPKTINVDEKYIPEVKLQTNRTRTPKENKKTDLLETAYKSSHECTSCALTFKSFNHLRDHDKQVHACEKNVLCNHCGKSFATERTRNLHIDR